MGPGYLDAGQGPCQFSEQWASHVLSEGLRATLALGNLPHNPIGFASSQLGATNHAD